MFLELLIHILRSMATSFRARRVAPHAMLAAAAVLWPGLAVPAAAAHVQGTVVDAEDHPIAGARVEMVLANARSVVSTDAEGRYAFLPEGTGEARLLIAAAGLPPVALTVSVTEADVDVPPAVLAVASFADEVVVVATGTETR